MLLTTGEAMHKELCLEHFMLGGTAPQENFRPSDITSHIVSCFIVPTSPKRTPDAT